MGEAKSDETAVSGMRKPLFDPFKLEDNFPENHLLHRIHRFLALSGLGLRQYFADFCTQYLSPVARIGTVDSDPIRRLPLPDPLGPLGDERGIDAGVEGQALDANQPLHQAPLVAPRRAHRDRNTGQRGTTALSHRPYGFMRNGTLRQNSAIQCRSFTRATTCIS